jgi:hypothetical protein
VSKSRANLRDAALKFARGATGDQLSEARSLEGPTIPDGQKREAWLEDRAGSGQNSGPQ